jgi:hypothetical protein
MRVILAAVLLTLGAGSLMAQTAPKWTGEKRDLDSVSFRGSATISLDKQSVALGETLSVDIRFLNDGAGGEFYNPFLSGLTPLPGRLAIFSSDHRYLGDLITPEEAARRTLSAEDWTFIPPSCYAGKVEKLTAGYVPPTAEGGSRTLPAGQYFLQMIYCKSFLAKNPTKQGHRLLEDEEKTFLQFEKSFDREELFRSNVVEVRFIAR